MNNLTLRQLRYVEALARHRHFGRAAAACAVSQPALSMQVRALEAALGVPLFERGARTLRLTGFGAEFVGRAQAILRAVDELSELARAAEGRIAGPLRLGVIPTVAPYLLPRLLDDLLRQYPGLDLHLRETVTARLVEELADGRLDAAVLALPVAASALHAEVLAVEEFVLVRPAPEAARPVPSSAMLREMRLLLLEEGHCLRDQALALCDASGTRPRELLDASSLSTLVQMVASGQGVTLIPRMAIPVEARSAGVAVARFPPPRPARTLGMVWRRTSPIAPQLARIAQVVRASAEAQLEVADRALAAG